MKPSSVFRFAICLALTLGFVANAPNAVAITPALGTYQVIVLPITTGFGSPGVTLANSQTLIKRLSRGFSDATGGKISFSLKSVLPSVTVSTASIRQNNLDVVEQIYTKLGLSLKPDSGYAGLIIVGVVPKDNNLHYGGMANQPGQFVIINGTWKAASNLSALAHEVGHTLGLPHSNTLTCPPNHKTLICGAPTEYGDESDVMGHYMISYYESAGLVRFSALNLDRLGVLAPSQKIEVSASETFTLAPVYSQDKSALKLLYLPVNNHNSYAIEYRPNTGVEKQLSATKMKVRGSNAFWNLSPAYGVQIRLIASDAAWGKAFDSKADGFISDSVVASDFISEPSAVLSPPGAKQAGLLAGQSYGLSDGSTVRVVSADATKGAVVKITRPKDFQAPTIALESLTWAASNGRFVCPSAQIDQSTPASTWPSIQTNSLIISDNRKIVIQDLEVNGSIVASVLTTDDSGKTTLSYQPRTVGTFRVRVLATDSSGNSSASRTIDITSVPLPDPNAIVSMTFANDLSDSDGCGDFSIKRVNNVLQPWPTITASIFAEDWTKNGLTGAKMQVNGVNVPTKNTVDENGSHILSYATSGIGRFIVTVTTTSTGGKEVQSPPIAFISSYYQLAKPQRVLIESGLSSDGAIHITVGPVGNEDYTLTNLSAGIFTKTVVKSYEVVFLVTGIDIGKTFTATLVGTDPNGNTDGGSPISAVSLAPKCTPGVCYVGQEWVMTPGYFYSGNGKQLLTFEELVDGKWVLVTKIKLSRYPGGGSKYPYTYVFRKIFSEPGVHYYRQFEGNTYKVGPITSRIFTITILP